MYRHKCNFHQTRFRDYIQYYDSTSKSKPILAKFNYVEGTPTFKITYNGQCIKFKENADSDKNDKPYLSTGIYTDIF